MDRLLRLGGKYFKQNAFITQYLETLVIIQNHFTVLHHKPTKISHKYLQKSYF